MVSKNQCKDASLWIAISALLWAFCITLMRGWREPNDWALAHWLISYQFGILKRALPGTLLKLWGDSLDAQPRINVLSSVILILFCLFLAGIGYRILKNNRFSINSILVILVFSTSPFLVMTASLNGYFDHLIFILTIGCCLLLKNNKLWLTSLLLTAGVLIHENILLLGFPILALTIALNQSSSNPVGRLDPSSRRFIKMLSALFPLPLAVFLLLFLYQAAFQDSQHIAFLLKNHLSQFPFIRSRMVEVVASANTTPLQIFLHQESRHLISRLKDFPFWLPFSLAPIVILFYTKRISIRIPNGKFLCLGGIAATLLPVALHLIAWDTGRIWTFPTMVAFVVLWIQSECTPEETMILPPSPLFGAVCIGIVLAQTYYQMPLLEDYKENLSLHARLLLSLPPIAALSYLFWKDCTGKNAARSLPGQNP